MAATMAVIFQEMHFSLAFSKEPLDNFGVKYTLIALSTHLRGVLTSAGKTVKTGKT